MYNNRMINKKSTFFLGLFIFFIPFLGVPTSWRTGAVISSGLFLIILSIKIPLPKKSTKGKSRKEKVTAVFMESSPVSPRDNTIEKSHSSDTEIK